MTPRTTDAGPLDGLRVLDLTGLLPGPFATLLLADLGAEVIKVESRIGDLLRQIPPFVGERSTYFLSVNRNKRSLGLDLRRPGGRDVFLALARRSDVVLESFRPGRMARMGLGPDQLAQVNPRLVYCSLSGFGQDGPDSRRPGHDLTYLARSGVLALMARGTDQPVIPPVQIADLAGGLTAAYAICAALVRRERTGTGGVIDVAILDSITAWMGFHLQAATAGAAAVAGQMPLSGKYPFYNVYATRDGGHLALGALEPLFWREFCQAVDRPDLAARQFDDGADRDALFRELRAICAARSRAEWRALIAEHALAAEVVADVADLVADAHLRARGMLLTVLDDEPGHQMQLDTPVRMSGRPLNPARPAPELGADTRSVLTEILDLSQEEVDNLITERAAFEATQPARRIAPTALP